jgi:hypothetical protein
MNRLRLRFIPDDEWIGELFASVEANGFSGAGSAWFDKDSIRTFASDVSKYPLPFDSAASLSGGYGGNEKLAPQTTVLVNITPHDVRGAVRVTAQFETAIWGEIDLPQRVTATFLVTYGDLSGFGQMILDLIEGRTDEAVLASTPT